jgi:hypothetical protein
MALVKNPVGDRIYVWSQLSGSPSNGVSACVISAHGEQTPFNRRISRTWNHVQLVFYNPHNTILSDPGIMNVLTGETKTFVSKPAGRCYDYRLSKYQGEHGKNVETYDMLAKMDTTLATMAQNTKDLIAGSSIALFSHFDMADRLVPLIHQAIMRLERQGRWNVDIVTIRNRRLRDDVTLSDVIRALHQHGYKYTTIHCSFCRGPSLRWRPKPRTYYPPKI